MKLSEIRSRIENSKSTETTSKDVDELIKIGSSIYKYLGYRQKSKKDKKGKHHIVDDKSYISIQKIYQYDRNNILQKVNCEPIPFSKDQYHRIISFGYNNIIICTNGSSSMEAFFKIS